MRERLGEINVKTNNELKTKARFRLCEANDVSKMDYESDDSYYEKERINEQVEERRRKMIVNLHKKMGNLARLIDIKRFNNLKEQYPSAYEKDEILNPIPVPEPVCELEQV